MAFVVGKLGAGFGALGQLAGRGRGAVFATGSGLNNLWADNFVPTLLAGSGTVSNVGGSFVMQAGAFGFGTVYKENIGTGATIKWRVKSSDGASDRNIQVEYRNGALSDQQGGFTHTGGGYWTATHNVDVAKGAISDISLMADNRAPLTDLTLSEIVGVIGATLPSSLTNIGLTLRELVVVQVPGAIRIFVPCGNGYVEYRMLRSDIVANSTKCWTWDCFFTARRFGEFSFARIAHLGTGENTLAILQTGEAGHMGGPTHGFQLDDGGDDYARLLINGIQKPIDGLTAYRCSSVELQTHTHLIQVSNISNTLAKMATSHAFDSLGNLSLSHNLIWQGAYTLSNSFLAMLAVNRHESILDARPYVTEVLKYSPAFTPIDVTVLSDVVNTTSSEFQITGQYVAFDVEVLNGWTLPNRQFHSNTQDSIGPKCYFDVSGSYLTTLNEVWNSKVNFLLTVN